MGMDHIGHFMNGRACLHGEGSLMYKIRRMGAEDMHAEHVIHLLILSPKSTTDRSALLRMQPS
jgi:hypothetical protein